MGGLGGRCKMSGNGGAEPRAEKAKREERDPREKSDQPIVRITILGDTMKQDVQHGLMPVSR